MRKRCKDLGSKVYEFGIENAKGAWIWDDSHPINVHLSSQILTPLVKGVRLWDTGGAQLKRADHGAKRSGSRTKQP